MRWLYTSALSLFAVLMLSACGGGTTSTVPLPAPDGGDAAETVGGDGTVPDASGDSGGDSASPDTTVPPDVEQDTTDPCLSEEQYFELHLWKPTISVKCFVCHSAAGIAKNTSMVLLGESEPNYLAENFETVKAIAQVDVGGKPLLLLKPTNTHGQGHTGGEQFKEGSETYSHFEHFIKLVTGQADPCDEPDPPKSETCDTVEPGFRRIRRLTRFEYDRTISDLFGIESNWAKEFTTETVVNGFDNNADKLVVSPLLVDQYRKAAEEIVVEISPSLTELVPCQPVPDTIDECVETFITTFGKRAFRRPLSEKDVERYVTIYNLAAVEDGFYEGIKLVITAMLQSPYFLYRMELGKLPEGGGLFTLTPFEIASQLSFFIWGSMPDEELFEVAESGAITDPAEIEKQAKRMLQSPKARVLLRHFSQQWLDIAQLYIEPKDADTFPAFTPTIRAAMLEETARLMSHVVFDSNGQLPDFFNANYTFLSAALASYYGVSGPAETDGDGFGKADLSGTSFGGVLTQGSVLAMHAFANQSSPIHRGVMVRERLLCEHLPPPPPGIVVNVPEVDPSLTTRERFSEHSKNEPCSGCHALIDPIGFSFEHFDGVGRYRETDAGVAIDATGEIINSPSTNGTFDGVTELSAILADSADVHGCYALQWSRFAYGIEESPDVACLLADVKAAFFDADLNVQSLMVKLTQTPHFTHRRLREGEEPPDDDPNLQPGGDIIEPPPDTTGGDAELPELPEQPIDVKFVVTSDWDAGYCSETTVTNIGDYEFVWAFTMAVEGTITQIWNGVAEPWGDKLKFTGVDFNGTIGPGDSAVFGFCADK